MREIDVVAGIIWQREIAAEERGGVVPGMPCATGLSVADAPGTLVRPDTSGAQDRPDEPETPPGFESGREGRRFLAARRPEGTRLAGFWEFPGGKVEPGESREAALVRELTEEMSITPTRWSFWRTVCHAYPDLAVRLHFYHITDYAGTVFPAEGHTIRWVTRAEARKLPFLEADVPVVHDLTYGAVSPGATKE